MNFEYIISVLIKTFLVFCISYQCYSGENIADTRQLHLKLKNDTGIFELNILAAATLTNITVNGFKVSEISGLAWDNDENILYALSDNGYILHLQPVFNKEQLDAILFVAGYFLLDINNKPLKFKASDSEGLATIQSDNQINGDTQLVVSFERIPRIVHYTPAGKLISEEKLPDNLADISNYHSENKSMEAVTVHDKFGIITGTEFAMKDQDNTKMNVYSMSGDHWFFPLNNKDHGGLVDMTAMGDGSILALERSYGGLFPAIQISLHRLILNKINSESELIYSFPTDDDLFSNNFEGITHYKDDKYFMISDDNNHPFNRTILLYFSIRH